MVSKSTLKYIKSLQLKKNRKAEGLFIVEGAKNVLELLQSDFKITTILATSLFLEKQNQLFRQKNIQLLEASEQELASIGTFKTNNAVIAVAAMRTSSPIAVESNFTIALDSVNDPGNLGTILRIADWYGISNILCSPDCADHYNPKVIAASMGAFTRVNIQYTPLEAILSSCKVPVYGAFLEGDNVHQVKFSPYGILLMGSESHGVSASLAAHVTQKVHIPRFGQAESLNVAVATAIICDNFRRTIS